MALPANTGRVLRFLGYEPEADYSVSCASGEPVIEWWAHADTQPTEQEITDAAEDRTTVNGTVYSEWADPVQRRRRAIKGILESNISDLSPELATARLITDKIHQSQEADRADRGASSQSQSEIVQELIGRVDNGEAD